MFLAIEDMALSARSCLASIKDTRCPLKAKTCAIPEPIVPPPITATVPILRDSSTAGLAHIALFAALKGRADGVNHEPARGAAFDGGAFDRDLPVAEETI